jgi:hypothetical protein
MTLFLHVHPGGRLYQLPREEDGAEIVKSLAEVLGSDGCVVIGYDLPDQPRARATVLINGRTVETVEVVDVPPERDE